MVKRTVSLIAAALMLFSLFACGNSSQNDAESANPTTEAAKLTTVNVITLKGPTGMGAAKMISDYSKGDAEKLYNFTLASSPDEVSSALLNGSADIAACPLNLAAVLFNKTQGKIQMLAVNTLGVLSILENGDSIKTVADLKGKKIYATGQGSTPEYILNYILTENGIDPEKDVEIEYKTEHSELTALAVSGEKGIFVLPEPNVTTALMQNGDLRVALNLTDEWNKISDIELAQGCLVVRRNFAEAYSGAAKLFLSEYKLSVSFVNNSPAEAATLIESVGIIPKAAIAQKAIPNCNIVCLIDNEMEETAKANLAVLFAANPKSVGGKLPDDSFYCYLP